MGNLQSRRSLRRTQATTNLRGNEHETLPPSASLAWNVGSSVQVRKMSSYGSIMSTTDTSSVTKSPRTRSNSGATTLFNTKQRSYIPRAAHGPISTLDSTNAEPHHHRHKDSAVTIEIEQALDRHRSSSLASPSCSQMVSPAIHIDNNAHESIISSPLSNNDAASISSTIRFSVQLPYMHPHHCCCSTCRQIRHQRRKTSLRLYERLESCRRIVMTIRDPRDPQNYERSLAWGHWLKLARLYVKYNALINVVVINTAEEEALLTHFTRAYSAIVQLVEDERLKWWHLFDGGVGHPLRAVVYRPVRPQIVDIRAPSRSDHSTEYFDTYDTTEDHELG